MRKTTNYIVLVLVILLVIYIALLDTLAKPLFESQASDMYGAEVTVSSLEISPFVGKVTLHDLRVADRRNAMRDLAQADRAYIDISILKLAQDVIDIEELQVDGLLAMAPRQSPAKILRPLLAEDNPIAQAGLPNFRLPDVDNLIARQSGKLQEDIDALKQTFTRKGDKWRQQLAAIPSEDELATYRQRIDELSGANPTDPAAASELRQIYAELRSRIESLQGKAAEFRGDLQLLREAVDLAANLPKKHTDALIHSLGLSGAQTAQLGSQILRGDFDGLLQQVLAPLAYNKSGEAAVSDDMPIYIHNARVNGQLLPSAPGLSTEGELSGFAWPLELAGVPTLFKLNGSSLGGGEIMIDAILDHRGEANDLVKIGIDRIPLWEMEMSGNPQLAIVMQQALASINGQMSLQGEQLSGEFTQSFNDTVFSTELAEDAGEGSRLISEMLELTERFTLELGLAGTVFEPELSFDSDLDQLFAGKLKGAIASLVNTLTDDLENQISAELGPEIANARRQFSSLESLGAELEKVLSDLSRLSPEA